MVVTCSTGKDFEIQSWNEQGEIIKVEGMLTIAFSFIFPCSHIDRRKELYLIIKIPYMVDMSTNEYVDAKNDVKVVKRAGPLLTPEIYHHQNEKIKELSSKIERLEQEMEKLKKENHQLKILCGKADSGWKYELNWVYRYKPNGEPIGHDCPRNFTYDMVIGIRYFLKDGEEWCRFWYKRHNSSYSDDFTMPKDAFLWLQNKLPEQKKTKIKKSKIQKLEFKEKEDIIKHLEESDENIDDLVYLDTVIDFLWGRKGKKFGTNDFQRDCVIGSSSTVQIYLKMLVRCNIIVFLKKGWYKVNIK